MTWKKLPGGLKLVINASIIIAFCIGLFFAGIGVYGEIMGLSYAEAWANFLIACRK